MLEWVPIFAGEPPVLGSSPTTAWTVPDGHKALAKTLVLSNFTGTAKGFWLRIIPRGANPDDTFNIFENYQVPNGEVQTFELQLALSAGYRVQWAGVAGVRAYLSGMDSDT